MRVQSLPDFVDRDHMVFIRDYNDDDLFRIRDLADEGLIYQIEPLGNGRVLWFHDHRDALMFLLKEGK